MDNIDGDAVMWLQRLCDGRAIRGPAVPHGSGGGRAVRRCRRGGVRPAARTAPAERTSAVRLSIYESLFLN